MVQRASTTLIQHDIDYLNAIFTPLSYEERIQQLYEYFPKNQVLLTSSFGTKSVFILHLLHKLKCSQKVHFINTTYHFQETLDYKEQLTELFDLEVEEIRPKEVENRITREKEWWKHYKTMCCSVNKVLPLEPIKMKHAVWMSSLMSYQTQFRSNLKIFEQQEDIIKFHPLIDIEEGEFLYQMGFHQLPKHPLEAKGYGSVGCEQCTSKGQGRSGRWKGSAKQECGLHPDYFSKKMKEEKKTGDNKK
ncbi:MAG: phosphoadenylyl-sulfate reductase [Bacteroidota bacterium]